MKKYKLTKTTKECFGTTLYQIKATVDFGNVAKGELGGYIEKEENLSQDNNAWVSGNARVYGDANVSGNARVYGDAWVSGNANVSGNARITGDAWVSGKLKLLAGFFFGMRYNKEEIKYHKIPDTNNELIYKGDAEFGEEENDEVEITIEGKTKTISRKSAKALNLI